MHTCLALSGRPDECFYPTVLGQITHTVHSQSEASFEVGHGPSRTTSLFTDTGQVCLALLGYGSCGCPANFQQDFFLRLEGDMSIRMAKFRMGLSCAGNCGLCGVRKASSEALASLGALRQTVGLLRQGSMSVYRNKESSMYSMPMQSTKRAIRSFFFAFSPS